MTYPEKKFIMRKNYFIKKSFQVKFIAAFIFLLLLEALLIAALFMHMSGETLTTGFSGSHFVIEKTSNFFIISFAIIIFAVGTAMALAGILLFLILSHRIAGPLYRFEKTLEEVSGGDLSRRINLRKTDQLKNLQATFNAALEKFDSRIKELKNDLEEARRLASQAGDEGMRQKLEERISRIKEKLSFFKTS